MSCTLAMIVRNESANLPACFESVRGLFGEIVIVDTGSTDDTVKIARRFGARVFKFDWIDDFAAARNYGLEKVRTDYVFRLDADDRLPGGQRKRLGRLLDDLGSHEPRCYAFRVHSNHHTNSEFMSDELRLWPASAGLRFHGRVHERVRPEEDAPDVRVRASHVRLDHGGYATREMEQAKLERNLLILENVLRTPPVDPVIHFDHGRTLTSVDGGDHAQALAAFEAWFATRDPRHTIADRVAHRQIVRLELTRGDGKAAVLAAQRGLQAYPDDQVLVAAIAGVMASAGEYDRARDAYEYAAVLCQTDRPDCGIPTNFLNQIQAALATLSHPSMSG